ncbi:MAG: prepilin peptidase [Clostridia bacterium]
MEVLIWVIGLIVGSFLNVCIYRIPRKESIVIGPSHCTKCNTKLKVYDLVPIFSFLFLRGKCRYCGEKISFRYPSVELLNSLLFLLCYLHYGPVAHVIPKMILCSVLVVISFIDLDTQEIPNGAVLLIIGLGVLNILLDSSLKWTESLIGFFAVSIPMLLIAMVSKGGMGGGDIKLMAAAGLFLGWKNVLTAFFIACLIAGVLGMILILLKKRERKDKIPFGPFLAIGILISMLYGQEIIHRYLQFAGIL